MLHCCLVSSGSPVSRNTLLAYGRREVAEHSAASAELVRVWVRSKYAWLHGLDLGVPLDVLKNLSSIIIFFRGIKDLTCSELVK